MNILIDIHHPAHVHFFKNIIKIWNDAGIKTIVVTRDKDITLRLLEEENIQYIPLTKQRTGILVYLEILARWIKIFWIILKEKIDIVVSIAGISTSFPAKLLGRFNVTLTDTEDAKLTNSFAFRFSDLILVPDCYKENKKCKNLIKYKGYHELAYLYPNRFKPDINVLKSININESQKYILIRLVKWKAFHDENMSGITDNNLMQLIEYLNENNYNILISSERVIPEQFKKYLIEKKYKNIFNIIAYSSGYIGDSPTMATESALLGKPSILINPRIDGLGNMIELEKEYGLMYCYKEFETGFTKIKELLEDGNIQSKIKENLDRLLSEKIDVSQWISDYIIKEYNKRKN